MHISLIFLMTSDIFISITHRCPGDGGNRNKPLGRMVTVPGENSRRTRKLFQFSLVLGLHLGGKEAWEKTDRHLRGRTG